MRLLNLILDVIIFFVLLSWGINVWIALAVFIGLFFLDNWIHAKLKGW